MTEPITAKISEEDYQKVLDRLEPFQKKVKVHEDNIANLQKELANLNPR